MTEDSSWVGRLTNADAATKQRLKRCVTSVRRNFAAIRELTLDFDLTRQFASNDGADQNTSLTHIYKGKVYWKRGSVRYDFEGDTPAIQPDDRGRPKPGGKGSYSVIRTDEMAAAVEDNPFWGTVLNINSPPKSPDDWRQKPFWLTGLDPWLHYAAFFRGGPVPFGDVCRACKVIESREEDGKVLLRLVRENDSWVEILCDPASDDLPVRIRAGGVRDGKQFAYVGTDDTWSNTDGVWYPARHVEMSFGGDHKPVKGYDLTVRNLRVNDAARVPDAVFTVDDMPLPEQAGGSDNRKSPPTELIKVNGLVRQRRPTERPIRKSNGLAPAPKAATAPGGGTKEDYLALVKEYETARQGVEKAAMVAKPGDTLEAKLQPIARVEAEFAGRFLDLASKSRNDLVTVDALAGVLVNRFTPSESGQAAEILIRDHLQSKALVPIYRQLSSPALGLSLGGAKLLRASLKGAATREAGRISTSLCSSRTGPKRSASFVGRSPIHSYNSRRKNADSILAMPRATGSLMGWKPKRCRSSRLWLSSMRRFRKNAGC